MAITNILKPKAANGTSGPAPTSGANGLDALFTQNGKIGADEMTVNATGGEGGDGGNGTGGAAGANGGKGGNASITLNGNIFNAPATTSLVIDLHATGGNGGLGGTGTPAGLMGNGGNATVTANGNIIQPNKIMGTIELDAIAIGGNGPKKGNATATINGNIVQPSKGATTVILKAQASVAGPDSVANNGNANFGTKTATLNGNIVQGSVSNVTLQAEAAPSNGTANINGNIVQVGANTDPGTVMTLLASGNHISITNNKITLGKHTFNLTINGYSAYDTVIKDNEFKGTGTNVFNFTDNALPGPHADTVSVNLGTGTFVFNGNSNVLTGFNAVSISGNGVNATLTGGSGDDILIGGDGDDVINGGGGNDIIRGKGGNDTLDGGDGDDQLFGGDGDDTLIVSSGTDLLDGMTDPLGDTVSFINAGSYNNDGITGVTANLGTAAQDFTNNFGGVPTFTTMVNIQNLTGSAYNDVLSGDGIGNVLLNNTLSGGAGDDRLIGGQGNDTLNGGSNSDTAVYGGAYNSGLNYTIAVGINGNGTVTDIRLGSPEGGDTLTSIEFIEFTDGTYNTATQTFVPNGPPNTAPVLDPSKTPLLATQPEDTGPPLGPVGTLVAHLVDFALPAGQVDNVTDPDLGAQLGVALTGTDTANGSWFYSTDNGANWAAVGAVSDSSALLLAANMMTRLYFQPNANYNGTEPSSLTFRAWDRTSGSNGSTANVSLNGGTTAFSALNDTVSLTVTPVNDAPMATNLSAPESYTEDMALNLTDIVVSDVDSPNVTVTLTLSNIAAGALSTATSNAVTSTFAAGVWTAAGAIADVNILLAGVTFNPAPNFNGNFTIGTSVSDGVAPPVTGTKAFTGTAVNDAPFLDASKSPTLAGEALNAPPPSGAVGTLVSSLVDFASPSGQVDNVTDPDTGALLGIAITAFDGTNGTWWYSLDNGANWNLMGAASNATSNLLAADAGTRIYFQPNNGFSGTVPGAITFRAWDQTSGTNGGTANTTVNGGSTAFSAQTDTASISINGGEIYLGTNGNDNHTGTSLDDIMYVSAGTDTLDGGAHINGDTLVFDAATSGVTYTINSLSPVSYTTGFGPGQTTASNFEHLTGSDYNDTLTGDANLNILKGGASDDVLVATAGGDTLDGGSDNGGGDTASFANAGGGVTVSLSVVGVQNAGGGIGNITLTSIENLIGSTLGDTLTGSSGNNVINALDGDDLLIATTGTDTLDGGNDSDTVSFQDASSGVNVSLLLQGGGQAVGGGFGTNTLQNIENLIGGDYNDTLTGDAGDNLIRGGKGDDTLAGNGGFDTASYSDAASGVNVSLALQGGPQAVGGGLGNDTLSGFENLEGGAFNDVLKGDGAGNLLFGRDGDDVLQGGAGNDALFGGNDSDTASYDDAVSGVTVSLGIVGFQAVGGGLGSDALDSIENLIGSDYNDVLTGNAGANILSGGASDDVLVVTAGGDTLNGGSDNGGGDTADFSGAGTTGVTVNLNLNPVNTVDFGLVTLNSIENVTGTGFADQLIGTGGNNVLNGGGGDDTLTGGLGNDTLVGGTGIDTAIFTTQPTAANVTWNGSAFVVTGPDGTDTLSGIEKVDDGAGSKILLVGGGGYTTIAAAIAAASDGDTILVAPGSYAGFTINKEVSIVGLGNPGDVVIQGTFRTDQTGVNTPIVGSIATWLKTRTQIQGGYTGDTGINVHADNVSLTNLTVQDFKYMIGTQNNAEILGALQNSVSNLTLTDVDMVGGIAGFYKEEGTTLDGLTIDGGSISDALFGVYIAKAGPLGGDATDTTIQGTDFSNILQKGIYVETARGHTVVDNTTMNDVANYGGVPTNGANGVNGNAIDFNLKFSTYNPGEVIDITDNELTNVAKSGGTQYGAIVVEGRDDPGHGTYGPDTVTGHPADVSDLTVNISGGFIDDTKVGIRDGEAAKGNPTLNVSGPAITVTNVPVTNFTESAYDNHTFSLMTVIGTNGADNYTGGQTPVSTGPIKFIGLGDNDYLIGGNGDDILQGGAGDDTLDGFVGSDTADYSDALSFVNVDLTAAGPQDTIGAGFDELFNIDNLWGSNFDDSLIGDGLDNVLRGGAGDDILIGGGGSDTADYGDATEDGLFVDLDAGTSMGGYTGFTNSDTFVGIQNLSGSDFADYLIGDVGDNILRGGKGDDTLDGGIGFSSGDTADYSDADGNGLIASLETGSSSGAGLGNDTLFNIQNLVGSRFNDTLIGDFGDNVLVGNAGNDILYGHGGNNVLQGGAGTDVAYYLGREADLITPFVVTPVVPGFTTVSGGPDGVSDGLYDVERIKFLSPSVVSDVDSDGIGNQIFQDGNGNLEVRQGPGPMVPVTVTLNNANLRAVGTGQFNPDADRAADILLQDTSTGALSVVTNLGGVPTVTSLTVQPGAFNPGANATWQTATFDTTSLGSDWKAITTGDFDGDAASDVLLQNQSNGNVEIMFLNRKSTDAVGTVSHIDSVASPGANWNAIAAGDFDGNGKSDILWQNSATKAIQISLMDGANATMTPTQATANLTAVGTGDFNGDGNSDILFKNAANQAVVWFMYGASHTGTKTISHPTAPGLSWRVSGAADVDGNGYSDVIWNDVASDQTSATLLKGPANLASTTVLNSNFSLSASNNTFHLIASTGGG